MTAQLIQFPRPKKRGAKVRNGPLCEFHDIAPTPAAQRVRGSDDGAVNRLAGKIQEALSDPQNPLSVMLRAECREGDLKLSRRFEQWQSADLISAREYAACTLYASATDHFGEGPDAYRWAFKDADGEGLQSPWHRDRAFALAIECLNTMAHAVRYGALKAEGRTVLRPGYDQDAADAYAQGVLSTLGRTIALLKEFGAGVDPV